MRLQYDNQLLLSFRLWLDHRIQNSGQAFTNYSGQFYPVRTPYQGYQAFSAPFRQLNNDTSVPNANVLSGVYLNGTFVGIGTSGLAKINHDLGTVYFTGTQIPNNVQVSGRYAIKDFSINLSDLPESYLLYETKYVTNSKFNQTLSGLPPENKVCPAIFLRVTDTQNRPFAFGGIDDNFFKIRAVVIADNEFQKLAVCNIMKNMYQRDFGIVTSLPFDYLGNYTGTLYNYTGLTFNSTYTPIINEVKVIHPIKLVESTTTDKSIGIVDFEISTLMRG